MSQSISGRPSRSGTASSVDRRLVDVTAPPALFPPTAGASTAEDVAAAADGQKAGSAFDQSPDNPSSLAERRGIDPAQLRVPQTSALVGQQSRRRRGSVNLTLGRAQPAAGSTASAPGLQQPSRSRSRTINSIFPPPSEASTGSPGRRERHYTVSSPLAQVPSFGLPRATSPTSLGTSRRRSSVSSNRSANGPPGVPVALRLPEDEPGSPGREHGRLDELWIDEQERVRSRSTSLSKAGDVVRGDFHSQDVTAARVEEENVRPEETADAHREAIVDHLDVIDPTVSIVSHLQNMSSSILLPGFMSSRAVVNIPHLPTIPSAAELDGTQKLLPPAEAHARIAAPGEAGTPAGPTSRRLSDAAQRSSGRRRASTAATSAEKSGRLRSGTLGSHRSRPGSTASYAKVGHDDPLDAHVADVLTRRQKLRRALKGLGKFLCTPLGVFALIYGIAVVFWGAAIVFFLAGWIVKEKYKKDLWVEISSQIVNGLFTITGVGLFPQRCLDAWRISRIYSLQRKTLERLRARGLPCPANADDLPDPLIDKDFVQVLDQKQQDELRYQQEKFSASQTWYRPHETVTHRAFPIHLALLNTLFMVGNSLFQIMLDCTMWSLSAYSGDRILLRMGTTHSRPPWTTGCLIPLSFLCGIAAAIIVWRGGAQTKKVAEVEEKLRDALGIEDGPEEDDEGQAEDEESLVEHDGGFAPAAAAAGVARAGEKAPPASVRVEQRAGVADGGTPESMREKRASFDERDEDDDAPATEEAAANAVKAVL